MRASNSLIASRASLILLYGVGRLIGFGMYGNHIRLIERRFASCSLNMIQSQNFISHLSGLFISLFCGQSLHFCGQSGLDICFFAPHKGLSLLHTSHIVLLGNKADARTRTAFNLIQQTRACPVQKSTVGTRA